MKLFEIKEGYFKKLCQEIFDHNTTYKKWIEDSDQYLSDSKIDVYIMLAERGLDCNNDVLRIVDNGNDPHGTRYNFYKGNLGKLKKLIIKELRKGNVKEETLYSNNHGTQAWLYEYDGVSFIHLVDGGLYEAFFICEDLLK